MTNQLATTEDTRPLWKMMQTPTVMQKFQLMCGKDAGSVMINVINAANSNPEIWDCDPNTVITSALNAAAMNLSLVPGLGQATILPYNKNKKINGQWVSEKRAELVPMVRGIKAMALRTGKYKILNEFMLFEGQTWVADQMTGLGRIEGEKASEQVIGYGAFLRLTNGYEATVYMTADEVMEHAKKFSPTYNKKENVFYPNSRWISEFDQQALKTVMKRLIKHKGVISDRDRKLLDELDGETAEASPEWSEETFSAGEDVPEVDHDLQIALDMKDKDGIRFGDLTSDVIDTRIKTMESLGNKITEQRTIELQALRMVKKSREARQDSLLETAQNLGGTDAG